MQSRMQDRLYSRIGSSLVATVGAVLLVLICGCQHGPQVAVASADEAEQLAVLATNATPKQKADACLALARIGSANSIKPLTALLRDASLAHLARYALETMPGPAVDRALRETLGEVKGLLLVGVIGSLGVRQDGQAVGPLAGYLDDADADVAQAAARALGNIGNEAATQALLSALNKGRDKHKLALAEALLRAAERLCATGQPATARDIYAKLDAEPMPQHVRMAALRGTILCSGDQAGAHLAEALRHVDYGRAQVAVKAATELKSKVASPILVDALPQLDADRQVLVIQALGKLGAATALPILLKLADEAPKPVRLAALRALPEVRQERAIPSLVARLANPDQDIARAAQEGLAGWQGTAADAAVMDLLKGMELPLRVIAVELAGQRRLKKAVPMLLSLAGETDPKLRQNACRKLGELGSVGDLPFILDLLARAESAPDREALEYAVNSLCLFAPDKPMAAQMIISSLSRQPEKQKGGLLRLLSSLGGAAALKAVREAAEDPRPEVRADALRALGEWKTMEAVAELWPLLQAATQPADKMRCLRSYLRLAALPDILAAQRMEMCRQVAGMVQRDDEKKLFLSVLGGLATPESLALIQPLLADAGVKDEACAAVLSVAEKLNQGANKSKFDAQLGPLLQKVVETTANAGLRQRAEAIRSTLKPSSTSAK